MRKAFMIITWGCQMNEDDSLQMANLLERMGYRQVTLAEEADIVLLNTCSVRDKPERKVMSKLGELKALKKTKDNLIIGVCGCMAQRAGEEIVRRAPHVDMVIGTSQISDLPQLISRVQTGEKPIFALDLPKRNGCITPAKPNRIINNISLKHFVPIMYGCNNFCAYCVVPFTRGPERSRPIEDIVAEVKELVSHGCREVTLLGQNVNSYGRLNLQEEEIFGGEQGEQKSADCSNDFPALLEHLNAIEGLWRIRFTTSHPKDLSDRLINAIAKLPKVCEHLHLPIQTGDNEILRAMNRHYTVEHYISLVEKIRKAVPQVALTTDIMVGFPGETEEQFQNTLNAVKIIRFDGAFMFAFNPRPGTSAADMPNQVDSKTKQRRLMELINLQNQITLERNEEEVGRKFEVLVEGPSWKDASKLMGYTRTNKAVVFQGDHKLSGTLVTVVATRAHPWGFTGELIDA